MSNDRMIKVLVFAEFMCPYSYLGHKAINDAISECSDQPLKFDVEYRPFRLCGSLSADEPIDRQTYLHNKFGPKSEQMVQQIKVLFTSAGLETVATGLISRSTRAHRLSMLAYRQGGQRVQQALLQRYFESYFGEGKDLGNVELLAQISEEVGLLPANEATTWLKSNALEAEVEATIALALSHGIRGSPVVIIDGKFKLDGMQNKDTFVQIFRRLGKCDGSQCHNSFAATGSPCSEASSDTTVSPPPRSTAIAV